jgi:eukaryotic-like serine/threonine-protein kinase
MSFIHFLKSKSFLINIGLAIVFIILMIFLLLNWLTFSTNHRQEIIVPDVSKMSIEEASSKLNALDLDFVVLDTMEYNKEFPRFSIVLQDPLPLSKVKEGRKIYLKLNAGDYPEVTIPNIIEKTFRQAEPTLKGLGLELGNITYKPYLGKDMVLEMSQNGKLIMPGDKVQKKSKIDLVLGDGQISFNEDPEDSEESTIPDN